MRHHNKRLKAHQVLVIAGVSGSGKSQLARNMSRPAHDEFTLSVLEQLDCDPNQHFKRVRGERMQRLMDLDKLGSRKTRRPKNQLLLFINLTSIHHKRNLKFLHQISKHTKRLDIITLYTSPQDWRQSILERLHTDNEPSMKAALIALSAKFSSQISTFLYHREYKKWFRELQSLDCNNATIINTLNKTIYPSTNPPF